MPTVPRVTLSLYADDAMFLVHSASPARARFVMQQQMQSLTPWLEKWRIAINTDKSAAICFRKRRRMPRAQLQPVTLDGEQIAWKTQVKYLGVTFDSKLNFAAHAKNKLQEAKKIQGALKPLIGGRSTLSSRIKVTIFLLVVRSVIMYASTAWWAICAKTHKKKLQVVQNKSLRWITKMPWYVRNETIRQSVNVPTLDMFAITSATKFFRKAGESHLDHIRLLTERHNIPEDFRPRPIAILDQPP